MSSADRGVRPGQSTSGTRGASEIVGLVLLLGVVVLGIAALMLTGEPLLDNHRREIELSQAEQSLSQFDARVSRVALSGEPVQQIDLGLSGAGGTLDADETSGRLRVRLMDEDNGTTAEVVNTSLGAVTYELGRTTIAYQGGGVWRRDGSSSVMISRPEFHYQNGTLMIPVIRLGDVGSIRSDIEITRNGSTVRMYPNRSAGWENRLENRKVRITVQSSYYDAWGRYFEQTTNGIVRVDHAAHTASVTFLALPDTIRPLSGVIATSGPGKLELKGTGAYINSYNSSRGDYASTAGGNGVVEAVGDVNITGDAEIDGTVRSGGVVDVDSRSGTIDGDVYWTDAFQNDGTVTGNTVQIGGVNALEPIDSYVIRKVDQSRRRNDNSDTGYISGNELSLSGSSGELGPGTYYLDHLDLSGKRLELNATGGDIAIGVRDWMRVTRDGGTAGHLSVTGNGTVRLFLAGRSEVSVSPTGLGEQKVNLFVGKGSAIHVPDEQSPRLRVLSTKDLNATIAGSSGNGAEFDGVIYAPAGEYGSGYTYAKHADVYGAIVTGNLTLGQYGSIHFDRGLARATLPLSPTVSRLDYLYVSVRRVDIEDA